MCIKKIFFKKNIPKEYFGMRFDIVLSKMLKNISRNQLSQKIKSGMITLNNNICKPKQKVYGGEQVIIKYNLHKQQTILPRKIELNIVYEDTQLLIINKQSGLIIHPGSGNLDFTLMHAIAYYYPKNIYLPKYGIIHRLDKNTTGLLIIAKTNSTYLHLIRQMQKQNIYRYYIALVYGNVYSNNIIHTFYGRHPKNRIKMSARVERGKYAITTYSIYRNYKDFTLLNVQLRTGRTHQIRAHMEYINHPIVGDPLYKGTLYKSIIKNIHYTIKEILKNFSRQALHAYKLIFFHPEIKKKFIFLAPLPRDFKNLIIILNKYSYKKTK